MATFLEKNGFDDLNAYLQALDTFNPSASSLLDIIGTSSITTRSIYIYMDESLLMGFDIVDGVIGEKAVIDAFVVKHSPEVVNKIASLSTVDLLSFDCCLSLLEFIICFFFQNRALKGICYAILEGIPRFAKQFTKMDGVQAVVDAFEFVAYQNGESRRFTDLARTLKNDAEVALQTKAMKLVNTLLTLSEMDVRRGLRAQLDRVGWSEGVTQLQSRTNLYEFVMLILLAFCRN